MLRRRFWLKACARLMAKGQQVICNCEEDWQAVPGVDHVVFFAWKLADAPYTATSALAALLHCVRQCTEQNPAPRLWIVTRGGALGTCLPEGYESRPAQCALWGFGRVISSEYNELCCANAGCFPKTRHH